MKVYGSIPFRVLSVAMSVFLIWQSYRLIQQLSKVEGMDWSGQLLVAILINLFVTGIFAFAGFGLPTQILMPSKYYQIHHSRKLKKWYKRLGVEYFRNFLLVTFWKNKQQRKNYFNGKVTGLKVFKTQTKKAEFGHLFPFVLISTIGVYFVIQQLWGMVFFTMTINIVFNFYPILLQRHHRLRLARVEKIMKRKEGIFTR